MNGEKCDGCRFYHWWSRRNSGQCRRYPPMGLCPRWWTSTLTDGHTSNLTTGAANSSRR